MNRFLLQFLFVLFILSSKLSAQYNLNENKVWAFGSGCGIDFTSGTPVPIRTSMESSEACATVSDANGHLLFYTSGDTVYNKNGRVMPNGAGIIGIHTAMSAHQGVQIVPVLDNSNQYYIFSQECVLEALCFTGDPMAGRLFYTVVDMNLNGGLGDVVATEKAIFLDSGLTEKLTAMVGTRCNIWVITKPRAASEFKSFEVTASGVRPDAVVSATGIINYNYQPLGGLTPSPDNKKILCCASHIGGGGIEFVTAGESPKRE